MHSFGALRPLLAPRDFGLRTATRISTRYLHNKNRTIASRKMSPGAVNGNGEVPPASPNGAKTFAGKTLVPTTTARARSMLTAMFFPDPSIVPNPVLSVTGEWTVDKALEIVPTGRFTEGSTSPIPYFHLLERLKTNKREGWRRFGIERGESISDHMYRMAMMSQLAPAGLRERLDLNKCMRMCLIHDMAESLVGDITPVDGVAKPEKSRREAATMDYISTTLLGGVGGGAHGRELRAIWQEYEDSETLDSLYVHDIDKLELLTQMIEYERRAGGQLVLGEFAYVQSRMVLPETKAWGQEILDEREAFWKGKKHVHGENGAAGGIPADHMRAQDEYYGVKNSKKD
jgi:putative hydrolases of HD superfamily